MSMEKMGYQPTPEEIKEGEGQMDDLQKKLTENREKYFEKFGIKDVEILKEIAEMSVSQSTWTVPEHIEEARDGVYTVGEETFSKEIMGGKLKGEDVRFEKSWTVDKDIRGYGGKDKASYYAVIGKAYFMRDEARQLFEKYSSIKGEINSENWNIAKTKKSEEKVDTDKILKEYL